MKKTDVKTIRPDTDKCCRKITDALLDDFTREANWCKMIAKRTGKPLYLSVERVRCYLDLIKLLLALDERRPERNDSEEDARKKRLMEKVIENNPRARELLRQTYETQIEFKNIISEREHADRQGGQL